jgi:hypothetical protein
MMPDNLFRDLVASNVHNDDRENNNDPYKAFCVHEIDYSISKDISHFLKRISVTDYLIIPQFSVCQQPF